MEEHKKKDIKESNLVPLHFTMSKNQYEKLRILKTKGYCKIMYILRFAAVYIVTQEEKEIKAYKDFDFRTKEGKHYKVDLPKELYEEMQEKSSLCGFSLSKLLRIGLNDILKI